jgi:hypothetical protein
MPEETTIFTEEGKREVMVCSHCMFPILTDPAQILSFPAEVKADTVYQYELDVLGAERPVYSATNPAQQRFDVMRTTAALATVEDRGEPEDEASWFPGYAWTNAHCKACGIMLGWGFVESKATIDDVDDEDTLMTLSTTPELEEPIVSDNIPEICDSEHMDSTVSASPPPEVSETDSKQSRCAF